MSSLVRRSLRTTVAAAGIAAVGVGLAGPAFAAPALPEIPQAPEGMQVPEAGGVEAGQLMESAPAAPEAPTESFVIPGVVNFEMPTVTTAAPELPAGDAFAVPTAPEAPAAPETDDDTDGPVEFEAEQVEGPSPESFFEGQNSVGAMQALDMASLAMEMAQGAAAGDSITEDQQIG